ncbi:MAG: Asp-tRNA(Asn)/Glu-tRNA(Gln) amidotransferase subunit GatA [Deltaproteobacteria bacterium]|jgi:aspartyl-tRNA(Asn)/glutamyl-tRNA(Gln) amidotransferase subunit A|nr:Asp-tRNA(Asn)/Glu-tRNA(Gln) amidotransferase subunit GatA [Deltaproteobacteria bacterium]
MTDIHRLGLRQTAQALQAREFSATDAVSAALERIRLTEPRIGACVTVLGESALREAKLLDESGPDPARPLWGVPLAVKDVFDLKGAPTTAGSRLLENYFPAFEATVVERLRAAGAIFVSKANCDEFAMGSTTEFSAYGPTKNPWDPALVPGGSSGGSAAAVAALQVPGAMGTDTGGSIRQPAALCGCVGLKPTYGRVSRYGIVAFASSLDQAGPFARSVGDVALLLSVIAGPDGKDSTCSARPVDDYLNLKEPKAADLTLGLPDALWSAGFEPSVDEALSAAKKALTDAGVRLKSVSMPNLRYSVATYYILAAAEASSNLARYDGVRYGQRAEGDPELVALYRRSRSQGLGPEVRRRIMLGTFVLSSGYYDAYFKKAAQTRRLILGDYQRALGECDYLLAPVTSIPAWPLGSFTDDPLTIYQLDMMTLPLNLAGGPGLSLPAGLSSAGLPVGVQLWGPSFGEAGLLSAGALLERIFPPVGPPPMAG